MYLKKLIALQKKAIKYIGVVKFCYGASPYYNRFKIIKLTDLYKLEVGKFVQPNFKKRFLKFV